MVQGVGSEVITGVNSKYRTLMLMVLSQSTFLVFVSFNLVKRQDVKRE